MNESDLDGRVLARFGGYDVAGNDRDARSNWFAASDNLAALSRDLAAAAERGW